MFLLIILLLMLKNENQDLQQNPVIFIDFELVEIKFISKLNSSMNLFKSW